MSDAPNYKTGVVTEVAGGFAVVAFEDLEGLKTKPIPVIQSSTGLDKSFSMPKVGEHIAVLMDENMEDGVVLGAIYSEKDVPPAIGNKRYLLHEDGTLISYDCDTHQASIIMDGCSFVATPSGIQIVVGGCTFAFSSSGLQVTGGDVKADAISLKGHKHGNVQSGSAQTGVAV